MNNLKNIDTQTVCAISTSARLHLSDPENKTFLEMAYSSAGELFTDSKDFTARFNAFVDSGITINAIMAIARVELQKRLDLPCF